MSPQGLALSPDGKTACINDDNVIAANVPSAKIKGYVAASLRSPYGISITPDGTTLYAGGLGHSVLSVIDTATFKVKGSMATVAGPLTVVFDPRGNGYVLNADGVGSGSGHQLHDSRFASRSGGASAPAAHGSGRSRLRSVSERMIADCNKPARAFRAIPSVVTSRAVLVRCLFSNRMECEEKSRLIEEHSRVAVAYSRAARALRGRTGTRSAEDQQALDEARIKSQDARAAVKRHIAEHGC
jgi:YVTN family beta-propeller protein